MYKDLVNAATYEQLKEFATGSLAMIKETNKSLYEDLETFLYKMIYGCHFSKVMLETALKRMENKDGSRGGHWSVEQTNNVAKSNGVSFVNFNEYDFNYVMNIMYSDYYGAVSNEVSSYLKLALAFLEDRDAPEGKALRYYLAMSN